MRRAERRFRRRGGGTAPASPIFLSGGHARRRRRLPWLVLGVCIAVASAYGAMVAAGSLVGLSEEDGRAAERSLAERLVTAASRPAGDEKLAEHERFVATAKRQGESVSVYARPGDREPEGSVEPREGQESPLVFSVLRSRDGWLEVLLPVRPNESTGWIRERDVSLGATDWEIEIDLSAHEVTAREGGEVFDRFAIGLGQPETPTPAGEFYITELIRPPERGTIYGAYVFVLSGFSEKLTRYAGGNGELGLHGTNDTSGLGEDVSHGCIRMSNTGITELAERLPLGTPVTITP